MLEISQTRQELLLSPWQQSLKIFCLKGTNQALPVKSFHVDNSIPGMMARLATQPQWRVKTAFHLHQVHLFASRPHPFPRALTTFTHLSSSKTPNPVLPRRRWAARWKPLKVVRAFYGARSIEKDLNPQIFHLSKLSKSKKNKTCERR